MEPGKEGTEFLDLNGIQFGILSVTIFDSHEENHSIRGSIQGSKVRGSLNSSFSKAGTERREAKVSINNGWFSQKILKDVLQKSGIVAEDHCNHDQGRKSKSEKIKEDSVEFNLRIVVLVVVSNSDSSSTALTVRDRLKGLSGILDCIKACKGDACMKEDVPTNKDTDSNPIGLVAFDPEGGPGLINECVDHVERQRERLNVFQKMLFSEDWSKSIQWVRSLVLRQEERIELSMVIKRKVE